jgi:hypothetical protein
MVGGVLRRRHDSVSEERAMWSKIRLGSNVLDGPQVSRTCFVVGGVRLFEVDHEAGGPLSVSADLYDDHGRRLGTLVANRWTSRDTAAFVRCESERVVVEDVLDAAVLLDVSSSASELIVSVLCLRTRDARVCTLDERGGLTLDNRSRIGQLQYVTGHVEHTALHRIDVATLFSTTTPTTTQRHATRTFR